MERRQTSGDQASARRDTLLRARAEERDNLLRRLRAGMEVDEQVVAAFLFGSFGRGEGDALSDLDLWVLLEDSAASGVMQERRRFAARVEKPLAVVEAPQNAPGGGAYLMALYPGETGPHQVDWYWQPAARGAERSDLRVLFDRREEAPRLPLPLPAEANAEVVSEEEELRNRISGFWSMLLIQAKYVGRKPWEEGLGLLGMIEDLLRDTGDESLAERFPPPSLRKLDHPNARLAMLRDMAECMEARMKQLSPNCVPPPFALVPQTYRFLDFIGAVCEEAPNPQISVADPVMTEATNL